MDSGLSVRPAAAADAASFARISTGPVANKHAFIVESFERRYVYGAYLEERPVGYAIWDRAFFGRAFLWLLGVDPEHRRRGIATRLLRTFEQVCAGEPVFTSTNASNVAMHAVLAQNRFTHSGRLENIDPGDPEIFYFKKNAGTT